MAKYQPIIMPRSKKYGNNYWKSFSIKENRIVTFYSDLEYKNWLTIEMNPDIEHFCEQPLEIELTVDGKTSKSVFDMWVSYKNGSEEFWEVKYYKDIEGYDKKSELVRKQIEKQKIWCIENHYIHKVRTENEIELGPEYINNLRYLSHLIKHLVPYKDVYPFRTELLTFLLHKNRTVGDIINSKTLPEGNEVAILAYLIYDGTVKVNLTMKPFAHNTEVEYHG
ncbi:MAG: TnsA endonuclease N-terminal domain-containing protein [Mobilitalea sp.]